MVFTDLKVLSASSLLWCRILHERAGSCVALEEKIWPVVFVFCYSLNLGLVTSPGLICQSRFGVVLARERRGLFGSRAEVQPAVLFQVLH